MMADDTASQPYYTVMTDAAMTLISQMANGQNSIKSFRPVASDENHWGEDLATTGALTDIGSIQQTGTVQDLYQDSDDDPTKLVIQIDFDETKIDTSYSLNTLGLYATDQNGNEILYAVECLQHAQPMDKSTTAGVNTHYMTVGVGKASQVQLTITDVDDVSKDELAKTLVDYVKSADIKTVAYTDKQNTFTMQQTLAAGAVDGAGNKYVTEDKLPKTDLSGLQPKGDYATNPDLTALKNTVNSSTSGLPSKMATADANSKFETQADAKNKYVQDNHNGTINVNGVNAVPFDIPTVLSNNSDLFNIYGKAYTAWYSCSTDVSAGTMKNIPDTYSFVLKVEPISYISGVASNGVPTWNTRLLTFTTRFGNSYMAIRSSDDKGNDTTSMPWKKIAFSTDVQSAINQAHTDMEAEFNKRGNRTFWSGTQAQFDAIKTKDPHTEYEVTG